MRPRGTYGDVALAMLQAADEPRTVRELAERAQVGYTAAKVTATRLLGRGELEIVVPGRPARVQRAPEPMEPADSAGEHLMVLTGLYWSRTAAD